MVASIVKGRARAIMVLGTGSDVGKSMLVAALCRLLADSGVRVAPFKAQNMSLNSAATPEGLEIGRAQALQAHAARIAPSADMNPVLLKPGSHTRAQAVVQGHVAGHVDASDFGGRTRERFWPAVVASYARLARAYDVIVLEGAGSAAEINLRDGDIVNMAMAHEADARCLLLADIDRGGVFASIYGTLALLDARDRERIDAFAINKFRGNLDLLMPGIEAIEARVGSRCLGIIPHAGVLQLDEEDGVAMERRVRRERWRSPRTDAALRIAVVPLPHLANFTDFDALALEPSVDLRYTDDEPEVLEADIVMVPGSKETTADLVWLRARGLEPALRWIARERVLVGICGGLQMLGQAIDDPYAIESGGSLQGLGLLDLRTSFAPEKVTTLVRGTDVELNISFEGYEIHVGRTDYGKAVRPFSTIVRNGENRGLRDGAISDDGRIVGTYVHGIFACDSFRHAWIERQRARAGLTPMERAVNFQQDRERALDRWAALVRASLDLRGLLPEIANA